MCVVAWYAHTPEQIILPAALSSYEDRHYADRGVVVRIVRQVDSSPPSSATRGEIELVRKRKRWLFYADIS
jgi:hypothetical protein